jgi:hypothetical protein
MPAKERTSSSFLQLRQPPADSGGGVYVCAAQRFAVSSMSAENTNIRFK